MSRTAIVVIVFIALGAVSLGTVLWLFPRIEQVRVDDSVQLLQTAARLLQEMESADQGRLVRTAAGLAQRPELLELLRDKPADAGAREVWLNKLRAESAVLTATARGVAPVQDVFLLDRKGQGLVRNTDLNWTAKPPSDQPAVADALRRALAGPSQSLLIAQRRSLSRIVVVPVNQDATSLGLLMIAFPVDAELAKIRGSQLPPDVGFACLVDGGLSATSLTAGQSATLEAYLSEHPELSRKLLAGGRIEATHLGTDTSELLMIGQVLEAPSGSDTCGLLVVRPIGALARPIRELRIYLFAGTGFLFLLLLVVTVLFGGRLTRSLKRLEAEMMEVAHTGVGRPIQVRGPAIVRSLARLAKQLTGTSDSEPELNPDDDSIEDEDPVPEASEGSALGPAGDDPPPAIADGEEADYHALFDRFRASKRQVGEDSGKLDFPRFRRKLARQAQVLQDKYGCKAVQFEVKIKAGKVALLPKIIP